MFHNYSNHVSIPAPHWSFSGRFDFGWRESGRSYEGHLYRRLPNGSIKPVGVSRAGTEGRRWIQRGGGRAKKTSPPPPAPAPHPTKSVSWLLVLTPGSPGPLDRTEGKPAELGRFQQTYPHFIHIRCAHLFSPWPHWIHSPGLHFVKKKTFSFPNNPLPQYLYPTPILPNLLKEDMCCPFLFPTLRWELSPAFSGSPEDSWAFRDVGWEKCTSLYSCPLIKV